LKRLLVILALAALAVAAAKPLPPLGTQFHALAEGSGKAQTEAACLRCHSADLLAQQRLTEKQWTASVEKMMRWGAVVGEKDKAKIIAYLTKNYGPESKFVPVKTKPVSSKL
jgi:hypothetical protein